MESSWSRRQVAEIVELTPGRLRYWERTKFISPSHRGSGPNRYTFNNLKELEAAKQILSRGISLRRLRRGLRRMKQLSPSEGNPLLRLSSHEGQQRIIISCDDGRVLEPDSGQLLFSFEAEDHFPEARVHLLDLKQGPSRPEREPKPRLDHEEIQAFEFREIARELFNRGLQLQRDDGGSRAAMAAYETALSIDPSLAEAYTNLGNLSYELGSRALALLNYLKAATIDPEQPEALYNLANFYADEGDLEAAVSGYQHALEIRPAFADAHFNLALALEESAAANLAKKHWRRFMDLTDGVQALAYWRDIASRRLAAASPDEEGSERDPI